MTETQIQKELYRRYATYNAILANNMYVYDWESDFVLFNNLQQHVVEFEIKCTRVDFKHDFGNKSTKHNMLHRLFDLSAIPNRFYFVCPDLMLDVEEIPEYAGLIFIQKDGLKTKSFVVKPAPQLHNEPYNDWQQLANKLYKKIK